jgi:acyl-[acyl carrier protein]--UDP-N-acetylglucosamine O-acyltransferase
MRVDGNPSSVRGINGRRLEREGLSVAARAALRAAHQLIYLARLSLSQAAEILEVRRLLTSEVVRLLTFLEAQHQGRLGRAREHRRVP